MSTSSCCRTIVGLALLGAVLPARAIHYWTGNGADNNWSTLENWSTKSKTGAAAAALPTSSDPVYFEKDAVVYVDAEATSGMLYWNADNISVEIYSDPSSPKKLTCTAVNGNNVGYFRSGCTVYVHDLDLCCNGALNLNWKGNSVSTFECVTFSGGGAVTPSSAQKLTFRNCSFNSTFAATTATANGATDILFETCTYENQLSSGSQFWVGNSSASAGYKVTISNSTIIAKSTGSAVLFCAETVKIYDSTFTTGPCRAYGVGCNSTFYASNTVFNVGCFGNHDSTTKTGQSWTTEWHDCTVNLNASGYLYLKGGTGSDLFVNTTINSKDDANACGLYLGNIDDVRETVFDNSQVCRKGTHLYAIFPGAGYRDSIVVRGAKTRLEFSRGVTSGPDFCFEVPVGGYESIPVFGLSCTANIFTTSGHEVTVSPNSPAALVSGSGFYPLMYMRNAGKDTGYLNLANAPISNAGLPAGSYWKTLADKTCDDEAAVAASESWTALEDETTFTTTVPGLGVYLVGKDESFVSIGSFQKTAVTELDGAAFSCDVTFGKTAKSCELTLTLKKGGTVVGTDAETVTLSGGYALSIPYELLSEGDFVATLTGRTDSGVDIAAAAPVEFSISAAVPEVSNVAVTSNSRNAVTIGGVVSSTGGEPTVGVEVNFSKALTGGGELGAIAASASQTGLELNGEFSLTASGLDAETTYYYQVSVVNGKGASKTSDVFSVVPAGATTFDASTFAVENDFLTVVVTGTILNLGAGETKVRLLYSTDGGTHWTALAESAALESTSVEESFRLPDALCESSVLLRVEIVNRCGEASWTGTPVSAVAKKVTDGNTYVWLAKGEDWDGAWSDSTRWSAADGALSLPTGPSTTNDFSNLPTDREVTIVLPSGELAAGWFVFPTGVRIVLKGAEDGTSRLTTSFEAFTKKCASLTLDGLTFVDTVNVASMGGNLAPAVGGACFTLRNRAHLESLYFGQVGKAFSLTLDDSTANIQYIYTTASVTADLHLLGRNACLTMACFGSSALSTTWNINAAFRVPDKGFAETPIRLTGYGQIKEGFRTYGAFTEEQLRERVHVSVDAGSPAYAARRSRVQQLIAYVANSNTGFSQSSTGVSQDVVFGLSGMERPDKGNTLFRTYDKVNGKADGTLLTGIAARFVHQGLSIHLQ